MFTAKGAYILGILFVLFVPTGTVFLAFKESISMCDVSINGGKVDSKVMFCCICISLTALLLVPGDGSNWCLRLCALYSMSY